MLDLEYKKTAVSLGGLFEFETPACECFTEQSLRVDLTYEYPIKIKEKTKTKTIHHKYCFTTGEGLVDVNTIRSKKETEESIKSFIKTRESNVITNIPATTTLKNRIKYFFNQNELRLNRVSAKDRPEIEGKQGELLNNEFSENQHTQQLAEYIRDFGYLLTPPKNPRKINIENLSAFYDRLYALIILITELNKGQYEIDYNTLFYCTTFLANAKQVSLTSYSKDGDVEILSSSHNFSKVWEKAKDIKVCYELDGYDPIPEEEKAIADKRVICVDIENPYKCPYSKYSRSLGFVEKYPDGTIPIIEDYFVYTYDYILKKHARLSFSKTYDYETGSVYWPSAEDANFRIKICNLYASNIEDDDTRELIEFLMHIYAQCPSMKEDKNGAFIFEPEIDLNSHYAFEEKEMELLPKIAKKIIKKEMDYYLSNIHPVYNAETMTASWEIPNLLTAMYFSLFYYNPAHTIYKICERTDCGNLIAVTSSDTKKKYCSKTCNGIVTQRRFRKKEKNEKLKKFGVSIISEEVEK